MKEVKKESEAQYTYIDERNIRDWLARWLLVLSGYPRPAVEKYLQALNKRDDTWQEKYADLFEEYDKAFAERNRLGEKIEKRLRASHPLARKK